MLKTKYILTLILISLLIYTLMGYCATYTSQYPTQDDDHVKSTTKANTNAWAYYSTDPTKLLTGEWPNNSWLSDAIGGVNQRFHIDLGSEKIIRRIYYENYHSLGANLTVGIENFTFWGSNTGAGVFDDLVYANDDGWIELTVATNVMIIHTEADQADPQYIIVTNTTAYRYYAFKFADNHGDEDYIGIRRIELQTEDAVEVTNIMFMFSNF